MSKTILYLDFDGTFHSYASGWQDADMISDVPVKGAFEFIREAMAQFDVHVFSARSGLPSGIDAMKAWFIKYGWDVDGIGDPSGITFSTSKPPAHVSINDSAMTLLVTDQT